MKIDKWLRWTDPNEKETFAKIVSENEEPLQAQLAISKEFNMDLSDAKIAYEIYKERINHV